MLGGQRQEPVWPFRVLMGLASIPEKLVAFQGSFLHGTVSAVTGSQVVVGHLQWVCESLGTFSFLDLLVTCTMPAFSPFSPGLQGPALVGDGPCRRGLPVQASPALHSLPPCSFMATADHSLCGTSCRSDTGTDFVPSLLRAPFHSCFSLAPALKVGPRI